ncbi:MAG: NAD-binding protein [SAR324 cluster bacterium]|nr:NAD-binding protein [SAR324 cluster bacterium]
MPTILQAILLKIHKHGWKFALATLIFMYFVSWGVFALIEPSITKNYWWFFIVTASTVGYGDVSPQTTSGLVVGAVVIFSSVLSFSVIAGQVITLFTHFAIKIRSGGMNWDSENHLDIFGYHAGKTERIIEELQADTKGEKRNIILCCSPEQSAENPSADSVVQFVKGLIPSSDVLERACVKNATRIIVDLEDDSEAVRLCLDLNEVINTNNTHVVVALKQEYEYEKYIGQINPAFECVDSDMVALIVQACQDPGITRLYKKLFSNKEGQTGYKEIIPQQFSQCQYIDLLFAIKKKYDVTILAIGESNAFQASIQENPPSEKIINGGMTLFYVASERIKIDWGNL